MQSRSKRMFVCGIAIAGALLLMGSLAWAADTGVMARVEGRMQWIAGGKMLLIPLAGGIPLQIDLTEVPQDQYANLRQGASVAVDGVFSTDGRRMIATSVIPAPEREERIDGQPVAIPATSP